MEMEKCVEDLFSCPICFERFTEKCPAKILKFCGHVFCLKCLEQIYTKTALRGMIRCPLCNYRTVFLTYGFLGRKKVPKAEELNKIIPDCRVLRLLTKAGQPSKMDQEQYFKRMESDVFPKLVNCKLCKKQFNNPRMLPYCQHSHCLSCLENVYAKQNNCSTSFLSCPTCHNRIAFVSKMKKSNSTGGLTVPNVSLIGDLLPVDYALSTLMNIVPIS